MKPFRPYTRHLALGIATVIALAGCQNLGIPKSKPDQTMAAETVDKTTEPTPMDREALLLEWQRLKPGVERLLSIENELNELLEQVATLSQALQTTSSIVSADAKTQHTDAQDYLSATDLTHTTTQAQYATTPEPQIPVTQTPAPQKAPMTHQPTPDIRPLFSVQVASTQEPNLVLNIYKRLVEQHPNIMQNLEPNFQKAKVHNATYYRLKLGSFTTREAAQEKCDQLAAANVECLIANYTQSNFSRLDQY